MIYLAVLLTLLSTAYLLFVRGGETLKHGQGVGVFTLFAILFTTGLDGGLLLLPLLDFKHHLIAANHTEYQFTNPIAIEFGFWGVLNWSVYFVTACYFSLYEPKLKLFKKPIIKYINNLFIILTCAFSAWLLIGTLKVYLPTLSSDTYKIASFSVVVATLTLAIWSSYKLYYIKNLSVISTLIFGLLVFLVYSAADINLDLMGTNLVKVGDYFHHLDRFAFPLNSYHEFYLLWWMAWSIMIGQFIARFVAGLKVYQLFFALLITPSIPIAIWFAVLYQANLNLTQWPAYLNTLIALIGVIFTINSMDSLIRIFSHNLNLTPVKLGSKKYFALHFCVLTTLVVIYDFKVLNVNYVGMAVTLLWLVAVVVILRQKLRPTHEN